MEEINLKDLFRYFYSKILIIILITIFFGLIGSLYSLFIQTPMYSSKTTLLLANISEMDGDGTGIDNNTVSLNQKLVSTYREIIKSKRVLKQVINNLDLDYEFGALEKMISVNSINDTEIISVVVKNEDPVVAMKIANEVAEIFCDEIVEIYQIKNVNIIDKAEVNDVPYNVNLVKQIIMYLLIGVVLSCAVVFIMYYFDTTIKTKEEIEERVGLPVLGIIPIKKEARK